MRRFYLLLLILVSVLFFQCQKEPAYIGAPDPIANMPDPVIANLQGNVLDENGQPAAGVAVKVGSQTAITNTNGFFRIINAALDKNASLVVAEKPGYFKSYRTFSATSGANQVVIKLTKRTLAGTINALAGGDATIANGSKITLPANGVVVASSGAAYTGTVNVYAAYIDPTANDIYQKVPGSFMGDDKNSNRVLLSSYGMLAVELEGVNGEKLQIKTGSVANLTTAIPASAQASAPATILLWYVDEQTGLWKEEGAATKQGNVYVGDVKHFTYWNCDLSLPTIKLTLTLQDASGQPVVNAQVVIKPASGNYYGAAHGFTDSLGQVNGPIPSNMGLVMQVLDLCGSVVYSQNIGPFSQNTNLGTITIPSSVNNYVTIKGKLTSCSGTNVANGYAIVLVDNSVHYAATDANGNFATNYMLCSSASSAQILGVDVAGQQQGNPVTVSLTSGANNVGSISACGTSANQFVNYTIDGTAYTVSSTVQDSLVAFATTQGQTTNLYHSITGSHSNTTNITFLFMTANPGAIGTFGLQNLRVQGSFVSLVQPFNVTLTNYPSAVGQFYEGSLSGQYKDSASGSNTVHNISGTFKVRRIQ